MSARTRLLLTVLPVLTLAVLTGCSSGAAGTTAAAGTESASPTTSASPTGPPSGPRGGAQATQLAQIRSCLTAAGIPVPSGLPTGPPSGRPTGRPSGQPSGRLSPGATPRPGGPRGGLSALADPKIQAAIKACGISLPTGPPTNR
jgi:hypothetical protein